MDEAVEKARQRVQEAWELEQGRLEDWGAAREELLEAEAELRRLEEQHA